MSEYGNGDNARIRSANLFEAYRPPAIAADVPKATPKVKGEPKVRKPRTPSKPSTLGIVIAVSEAMALDTGKPYQIVSVPQVRRGKLHPGVREIRRPTEDAAIRNLSKPSKPKPKAKVDSFDAYLADYGRRVDRRRGKGNGWQAR